MKKIISKFRNFKVSLAYIIGSFRKTERGIFIILMIAMTAGMIGMISTLNQTFSEKQPTTGGTHIEGVIGSPRFINPVLASTSADRDMVTLVYSGLMRSSDTGIIPDLASSYTLSEDETTYTFTLRDDIVFHDNTPVTADDIIFTIQKIQDSSLESPLRSAWQGVRIEKEGTHTITFELGEPYAGFLKNTTVGILPRHLWGTLNNEQFAFSDLNIQAIGSGPYMITNIDQSKVGIPERITLRAFKKFTLNPPFIKRVIVRFFANEESLLNGFKDGTLDSIHAIDPEDASEIAEMKRTSTYDAPLPRTFGIFFNQNQAPIFLDSDIIKAFNIAINKEAIIKRVLFGFGTPLDGPLPPTTPGYSEDTETTALVLEERLEQANNLLRQAGWNINDETGLREKDGNPLSFSLATDSTPELKEIATIVKNRLEEIGVTVNIQVFETGNLEQDIIRPRNYDALLFGQALGHDSDLFAFWHSSQRNDPGLNVAMFTDSTADQLLDEALTTTDEAKRADLYEELDEIITDESPAIFLYSPHFIYIKRGNDLVTRFAHITTSADRLTMIHTWYKETQRVWKPFIKKQ
jgi:peptide/nickel transport system substrate-binding protein